MTRAAAAIAAATGLSLLLAACHPTDVDPMKTQDKILPYRTSVAFDDNAGMRVPPDGAVPRERILDPGVGGGVDAQGRPLKKIPLPVDLKFVERGRTVFDGTCAACHGVLGDGRSEVASKMSLIQPTSLHSEKARALPPGALYRVIAQGYGLMNSYAEEIGVRDRWAVVAYVHALQLSQDARVADLPAPARERLRREGP